MADVRILVIDDDLASQSALRQILDSEGWKVTTVPIVREGLLTLATGDWNLVIVNVAMIGVEGPLFSTLQSLAQSEAGEGKARVGVLFMVPELAAADAKPILEQSRLSYIVKPYHLHEFLERVSDLLLDVHAITSPIRQVRRSRGPGGSDRRKKERRTGFDRRESTMFASREDYFMTEEEIAEYEQQEAAAKKKKQERKDFV